MSKDVFKVNKAENTRNRLLDVALKQFNHRGFDQTTMRDLASAAGLSLGAFYYHFKSKEEVVQVYYEGTLERFIHGANAVSKETKKFEVRLIQTIQFRIKTFQEHRELLVALSRAAVDPRSELSPFGTHQKEIRDRTIAVFADIIQGSDLRFNKRLQPVLPRLLWMYMMGIIFFWVYDDSEKQKKTFQIIEQLTPLICRLIRFSRLPLAGRVISPVLDVLKTILGEQKV